MRLASRPAGSTLHWPTGAKMKAINQVHKLSDTDGFNWPRMWDQNYDWNGWLRPGLDKVAGLGANTVKMIGLGEPALAVSGTAFEPYLADRMRQYLDYAASLGLLVFWQVNTRSEYGNTATLVASAVANARILADYPNVVAIDLWNEIDLEVSSSWEASAVPFMQQAYAALKAVTPLPLTASLASGPPLPPTSAYTRMTRIAPFVDFWDFHQYHRTTDVTAIPYPEQFATFRTLPYYKPWLIGESGAPRVSGGGGGFVAGPTEQSEHWSRLMVMSYEPDCLGVVGFSLTDYDSLQFGVFAEDLLTAKHELSGPFAGWRDIR